MKKFIASLLTLVMTLSCTMTTSFAVDYAQQAATLVSQMTLEQKVGQMLQPDTRSITPQQVKEYYIGSILSGGGASPSTGNTLEDWANRADEYQKSAIEGFGIPLLYGIDAVHGNNNVQDATIFPHNIGIGQADDAALNKEIGSITAKEMRAMGANWAFTPTLGTPQNERWGRTYECFGEDVSLSAEMGSSYIEGLQSSFSSTGVMATAKHYIGEGITTNGTNQGDVDKELFDQELEDLLKPYKKAIDSGVKSVMVSYNSVDGVKCHGNKELITDILKEQLGFKGIVISDYNGVDQIEGNLSYQQKIEKAINAGMDMLMIDGYEGDTPKWLVARNNIIASVNDSKISMERINDAVTRILTVKCELGLIDHPESAYANKDLQDDFGSQQHRDVARKAVAKSLVLLKNSQTENDSNIMLDIKNMNNIAVVGEAGDDIGIQCGGWTISWQGSTGNITKGTTIFEGLREVGKDKNIDYYANGYFTQDNYDAIIAVIGERPYAESDGDRSEQGLQINDNDKKVLNNIKANHPDTPVIAVLITGRPITIADYVDDFDAIVMAGLPGSEGAGVADVLLGDTDFTGKLTYTWPWYGEDITKKFDDSSKVLFENGRGLTKSEVTALQNTKPDDPKLIDLEKTNGKIEAENYSSKHEGIVLENNNTSIGYFWEGYDISYKVNVKNQGRYTLKLAAATQNDNVKAAFDVYIDDVKYYSTSTNAQNTGGWANFVEQTMNDKISLPAGEHTIKFISRTRDLNIDYFKVEYFDDQFEKPEIKPEEPNTGTGAIIKENAVEVTMSSSENSGDMSWYKGNQYIENKNSEKEALDIRNTDDSSINTIQVNDKKQYQEVLGIGTSIEESTVNNLLKMSDEKRKEFLKQLVDPKTGMGNTLFRVTIGTADFTGQDFYTYYDGTGKELDGKPDWENKTGKGFSIEKDKKYGIIQIIKEIQEVAKECGVENELKFFASSWTPPGWMKSETSASQSYDNNTLLLKGGKLKDENIDDLAKYYVRFIEEYQKEGIPIYAITLQNEPLLEIDYPSCLMTGSQEAKLAKAIKEELKNSTVLSKKEQDVKIWAFDHNFDGAESFVQDLFASADGRDNVDGIAFHPYGGSASTMGSMYERYPDYTMHLTERSVWGTSGASDIITWFRNGSQSYNAWVTMLDSNIAPHQWVGTPDPTMFVQDANNRNNYWCTPEVYIIGQFTKYVRPGYVRIDSSIGNNSSLSNVAFKDPTTGKIVMIVSNNSGENQNFKVINNGTQFNATLPAGNVATYIWDPIDGGQYKNITDSLTLNDAVLSGHGNIGEDGILGNVDNTTELDFTLNVKKAGTYKVEMEVSSGSDASTDYPVVFSQNGKTLGQADGNRFWYWGDDWNHYSVIQTYITLEQTGIQNIHLSFPNGGLNVKSIQFAYDNDVQSLPGQLDTTNYINKHGCALEISDSGVRNFGYINRDHYLDYKVKVDKAGKYLFQFETSSSVDGSGVWIDKIENNETKFLGEVNFKNTGSTSQYEINTQEIELPQGEYTLRIKFKANNTNYRKVIVGQAISLTSDELIEGKLNGKSITVDLSGSQFVEKLNSDHWHLDLPEGVTYTLNRKSDTRVEIMLKGEARNDFDEDQIITIKVDSQELTSAIEGTTVYGDTLIKAIDDEEKLTINNEVEYGKDQLIIKIDGGTFNENVKENLSLTGAASQYVQIEDVKLTDSKTAVLSLKWSKMYNDNTGIIQIASEGYASGTIALEKEVLFKATTEMPEAIELIDNKATLDESLAYRHQGSLKDQPQKGNYVDFYIDIKDAGDYQIIYDVTNNAKVSNGLKISGGQGLATDNLKSITFNNFWNNSLEYRHVLNLKSGKQTLRFEMNNYVENFKIENIRIQKVNPSSLIGKNETVLSVENIYDGSTDYGWGIETKNDIKNVGCSEANAYQDYRIYVEEDGYYDFNMMVSKSSDASAQAVIQLVDDKVETLGTIDIQKTSSWDVFEESEKISVRLTKGNHILRVFDQGDGFNYRQMTLSYQKEIDKEKPVISGKDIVVYGLTDKSIAELIQLSIHDNTDGDIALDSSNVKIETDFDGHKVGTYSVKVTASDKEGNVATKTFTIVVTDPATISYPQDVIVVGSEFDPLLNVKAYDVDGTDITSTLELVSNDVDINKSGKYTVKYRLVDKYGTETIFERIVEVKDKESNPSQDDNIIVSEGQPAKDEVELVVPETRDTTNIYMFIAMMIISVLGMILYYRKKRFYKNID